jgi:hypothetical protein
MSTRRSRRKLKRSSAAVPGGGAHFPSPLPIVRIEADTDDAEVHKRQPLPDYLEEVKRDGKICVMPKLDFINEFRKAAKRAKLNIS